MGDKPFSEVKKRKERGDGGVKRKSVGRNGRE